MDLPCAAQLGLVASEATSRGVEDEIPSSAAKAPSRAGVPPQRNKRILRISPKQTWLASRKNSFLGKQDEFFHVEILEKLKLPQTEPKTNMC